MQCAGQVSCNAWSRRMQMTGQWQYKRVVKWNAILQQCRVLKRALKGAGPAEHGHGYIPAATTRLFVNRSLLWLAMSCG